MPPPHIDYNDPERIARQNNYLSNPQKTSFEQRGLANYSPPNTPPAPRYQEFPSPSLSGNTPYFGSLNRSLPSEDVYVSHGAHPSLQTTKSNFSEHIDPSPQLAYDRHDEKEVYETIEPVSASPFVYAPEPALTPARRRTANLRSRKTICGCNRTCCLIAIIICIILAIAIPIGVIYGRKRSNDSAPATKVQDPRYHIGGNLDSAYYSKSGAFNGSGVAVASVNFNEDPSVYVFYQTYTGAIKQMLLKSDGTWQYVTDVVTEKKALNATPLSTVAYINNQIATWHLFYVDQNNIVRQRVSSNSSRFTSTVWSDGPLNGLNLSASKSDMIGLQACYWGNFYGDDDGSYDDGFNVTVASTAPKTGMHLWYAKNETTFGQYSYTSGDPQWRFDQDWPNMNGQAGVGCQTWLTGTVQYVTFVDLKNAITVWWQDYNVNLTSTQTHPINKWVKAPFEIPDVHPSTSMGYTNYLAYQAADSSIQGYNISWAAENSKIFPSRPGNELNTFDGWKITKPGIPGTYLSITSLKTATKGAALHVFYQERGDDIKLWIRDNTGGTWSSADIPV